jgi:hypothetical protein
VTSFPQAALLSVVVRPRNHPGPRQPHDGFPLHAFAVSPWLGAAAVALVVLGCLLLALVKGAGRVAAGAPWPVRLALLAVVGAGLLWLLKVIRERPLARGAAHGNPAGPGPRLDPR